MNKKLQCIEI